VATYLWSSLANGDIITFDPTVDVLYFDDPGIPAAQITGDFYFDPFYFVSGFVVTDWYQAVLLLDITDQRVFTQTNFVFADGSVLLNGDGTVGTINDEGPNTLIGGAGSDQLAGYGGNDSLVGGAGNDLLNGGLGNDILLGGPGHDQIFDDAGINWIEGGDGDDFFLVADLTFAGSSTITGGAGRDEYLPVFATDGFFAAPEPTVLDFQPGQGGDRINLGALLFQAVDSGYFFFQDLFDPDFGFLWFFQVGADAVLGYDPDTAFYSGYPYVPVITLKNVSVSSLTGDNISFFATGSDNADDLVGSEARDFLYGGGGGDTLNGGAGADSMVGGPGSDVYYVDNKRDVVSEEGGGTIATGGVATFLGPGAPIGADIDNALDDAIDTVLAAISYSLENIASVENITLTGGAQGGAGLSAKGNPLANLITGNELNNELDGLDGNDTLIGAGGNDRLIGAKGDDIIDGGPGLDTAVFSGQRSAYTIGAEGMSVTGPDGSDTPISIERLQFADKSLAFDLDRGEAAGNSVRLIGAAFGTQFLTSDIVGIVVKIFDAGLTLAQACAAALPVMGSPGNAGFVTLIFRNVVEIDPPPDAQAALVDLLDSGALTQAQMLEIVTNLDINETHIGLVGMQQNGVEFL